MNKNSDSEPNGVEGKTEYRTVERYPEGQDRRFP
jgi:hypothetical protein